MGKLKIHVMCRSIVTKGTDFFKISVLCRINVSKLFPKLVC